MQAPDGDRQSELELVPISTWNDIPLAANSALVPAARRPSFPLQLPLSRAFQRPAPGVVAHHHLHY